MGFLTCSSLITSVVEMTERDVYRAYTCIAAPSVLFVCFLILGFFSVPNSRPSQSLSKEVKMFYHSI